MARTSGISSSRSDRDLISDAQMKRTLISAFCGVWVVGTQPVLAQHKIAYVDSEIIYNNYPEFSTAQQNINRMAEEWERDLEERQSHLDDLFNEYTARELLYTSDERQRKQHEIIEAEEELERLRLQYFGPDGELFRQQEQILRPIQEKVLEAIEVIAEAEDYDYVFDRGGDLELLFANARLDITDLVLEELGIDTQRAIRTR